MNENRARLLVPIDEAMSTLGNIGRTTFYGLIDAGEVQRVKIGRRAFITAQSLTAYVDRLTQTTGAEENAA